MKHKHAELIKKWADGAEIEYSFEGKYWRFIDNPSWDEKYNYRLKRPDWQRKLIDAAKEGKEVQLRFYDSWEKSTVNYELDDYDFAEFTEDFYRIKTEPKPDIELFYYVLEGDITKWYSHEAHFKVIVDGETGEYKGVESLK
jgi:hypothetical protein